MSSFQHHMFAHCESGAVTAQLNHTGLDITEAMVFGISGGIFFGYFNFPTMDFPTFVLRNQPTKIRKAVAKRLGIRMVSRKFKTPQQGMEALDQLLEKGVPIGVQVDFFFMNYIPSYARAHFNAHYINVVGRDDKGYLVSDAYSPTIARVDPETLARARSVRGQFAPKNLLFYTESIPAEIDYRAAIRGGIKQAVFNMLRIPAPFLGVRGIRYLGNKILKWPELARDVEHLSHEIMMIHIILEDRGTGGGGFRFLYATFLQEASKQIGNDELMALSGEMMENGNRWREISLFVARIGKKRDLGQQKLLELREMLFERAAVEKELFGRLKRIAKKI
ncbi:MAG: BtrH N-terminal domain-containing protein [Thermodesulfobacteriota bacterium]